MRRLPPSAGEQRSGLIGTAAVTRRTWRISLLATSREDECGCHRSCRDRTACDGPFGGEDRLVRIASTELMHAAEDRYRRRLLWRRRPRISGGCVDRARSHSTWL
jgi:hypothetical protein